MALITIETADGPKHVKVCDYCRCVCCQTRFCSGHCARNYYEFRAVGTQERMKEDLKRATGACRDFNERLLLRL